jgi:hypothetical protein
VQPDLDNKEVATWRSLDLIETLLYLADNGHSMQVITTRQYLLLMQFLPKSISSIITILGGSFIINAKPLLSSAKDTVAQHTTTTHTILGSYLAFLPPRLQSCWPSPGPTALTCWCLVCFRSTLPSPSSGRSC